ncbi:hypothetical protein LCGC14_1842110 [marine sediment metagenome]|uniref:Major capsid protein n=1 Tax=marine sediment metagenome TaxID=412755 RepID=A0A0F9GD06_9ZZZZ
MMDTTNSALLIRSELWSNELKEVLQDELQGMGYVRFLSEFPDGTTFTIPSIGEGTVRDYVENQPIVYDALDTGEFQLTITEYLSSGNYITKKARQDSFYSAELEASFVPKQSRALAEKLESDIMALGAGGASGGQTADDANVINGADHRFVATGTNEVMAIADYAKALHSLKKANVPDQALIGIVDPSVEFELNTSTNIVNVSNNPRFEGIINTGIASGMRFVKNVFGFDLFTSNYLATANETIVLTTASGKANMFFSAADQRNLPFIGAWRQMPEVDAEYNKDFQREEYATTARYGLKVYRPENLVVILSDDDQV